MKHYGESSPLLWGIKQKKSSFGKDTKTEKKKSYPKGGLGLENSENSKFTLKEEIIYLGWFGVFIVSQTKRKKLPPFFGPFKNVGRNTWG